MKQLITIIFLLALNFGIGQEKVTFKTKDSTEYEIVVKKVNGKKITEKGCLVADGAYLPPQKKRFIKYGTPLCIKVNHVNTFYMKGYSTYKPIHYDFSVKEFLAIDNDYTELSNKSGVIYKEDKIQGLVIELSKDEREFNFKSYKLNALRERIASGDFSDSDSMEVVKLEQEISELKTEIEEYKKKIENLTKDNQELQKKVEELLDIAQKTTGFKSRFSEFQDSFNKINLYTSLKNTLINQINRDSIFIENEENFKNRASSSYMAVYKDTTNHLQKKEQIIKELESIEQSFFEMSSLYQELNKQHKNDELTLSGELKQGKTVLKFDKVSATIETNKQFEEEMSKAKAIYDSLSLPKNKLAIIAAAQEGIDLYDEIQAKEYTLMITSENIYGDEAEIKPQLKNSKGKVLHEYRTFEVKTYGNLKVNGSAGYFLNFISDDDYSLRLRKENDPNSQTGVIKNKGNVIKNSLGALLHVYYNCKGDVKYGASAGLSINDDSDAGFYMGGSLFFTEKSRLVFTTGLSFQKVKRLNTANLIYDNGSYNFRNESDTEIRYNSIYKPSFFIGISYNLL